MGGGDWVWWVLTLPQGMRPSVLVAGQFLWVLCWDLLLNLGNSFTILASTQEILCPWKGEYALGKS